MSQSKKRKNPGNRGQSNTGGARRTPATPPVQRTPVVQEQQTVRTRVDRALPPFTTQRYVAIWILGMIPLAIILLVLLRPGDNNTATPGEAQPTTVAVDTVAVPTQAAGRTEAPVVAEPTGTTSTGITATGTLTTGAATGTQAPAAGAKYMVLDTSKGRIVAQLYTEPSANVANTIANFERKAAANEFANRIFHRVEDWVIQGGDPTGTGAGGERMPAEYNQISFKAGALGIARGADPTQNNDSQFFIVKVDSPHLDGQYTNWGQVIEGLDVVNQIAIGDKINSLQITDKR